jgi:hypothetical protein
MTRKEELIRSLWMLPLATEVKQSKIGKIREIFETVDELTKIGVYPSEIQKILNLRGFGLQQNCLAVCLSQIRSNKKVLKKSDRASLASLAAKGKTGKTKIVKVAIKIAEVVTKVIPKKRVAATQGSVNQPTDASKFFEEKAKRVATAAEKVIPTYKR